MTTSAILLDIEGATTSIQFVYDTLFPFVRAGVAAFLEAEWSDASVQADVTALRMQALEDHARGVTAAPMLPEGVGPEVREAAVANVLWQMDSDRKTTGLKSLQGKIWRHGYGSGELLGHIYEDVTPTLRAWRDAEQPIYIYSSGSIGAQKLLFGHSVEGDLTPLLSGYFDTTTGPKKEAASYRTISSAIGHPSETILFVTDNLDEARAAAEAGMQAVISSRPGNPPLPDHGFEVITSFADLL